MSPPNDPHLFSTNSSAIGWNSSSASPDSLATVIKDCVLVIGNSEAPTMEESNRPTPRRAKARSIRKGWRRVTRP